MRQLRSTQKLSWMEIFAGLILVIVVVATSM
jgi:hypothetical protein